MLRSTIHSLGTKLQPASHSIIKPRIFLPLLFKTNSQISKLGIAPFSASSAGPTNHKPPSLQANKTESNSLGSFQKVFVPPYALKISYITLSEKLNLLAAKAAVCGVGSSVVSGGWLYFTEQALLQSPVALATLIGGGLFISKNIIASLRLRQNMRLSIITNPGGPALNEDLNAKIRHIIAGDKPKIKCASTGLTISGMTGDLNNPSEVLKNAQLQIQKMNRVVLPECMLAPGAAQAADLAYIRWLERFTLPFSVLNIIAIATKDPKYRTPDDYVVLAAAARNIYSMSTGPSVAQAREKFTAMLINCKTSEEVVERLVDEQMLDDGAMSFLNEWIKGLRTVGVRIGRDGSVILDKNDVQSFGGPYPLKLFPHLTPTPPQAISQENTALIVAPTKSPAILNQYNDVPKPQNTATPTIEAPTQKSEGRQKPPISMTGC